VFSSKTYQSEGKLLLRLGRENAGLDPTVTLGSEAIVSVPYMRENEINSLVEILQGRALIEQLVDEVGAARILGRDSEQVAGWGLSGAKQVCKDWLHAAGLYTPASDLEKAISTVSQRLDVEPVKRSNVVRICYRGKSPQLCQEVVAQLIDSYLEQHLVLSRPEGAHEFLDEQALQLRTELKRKEDELRKLKDETGIASRETQRTILVSRIGRLEDELLGANKRLASTRAQVQAVQKAMSETAKNQVTSLTEGYGDEGTDGMRQQLYALRVAEDRMEARYEDAHPKLNEIRRQVAEAEALVKKEQPLRTRTTTGLNPVYQQGEMTLLNKAPELSALQAEAESLNTQLARLRVDLRVLNEAETRVTRLQREVELHDARYRNCVLSLEKTRIDEALAAASLTNVKVAQPATLELRPIGPRVLLNLALGLIAATFGTLGLVLFVESRDDSLRTPEDIQRQLRLPFLVSIPRFKGDQLAGNGRR